MANQNRKKTSIQPLTYKLVHWFLFLIVLTNLLLVFFFERGRRPSVVHETVTIVSNHVYVVTNVLTSARGSVTGTNGVDVVRPNDPAFEIELPYRYGVAGGVRYVDIGGRYFSEGSPTSYGVIVRVFPERIALDNGYFIKNHNFNERFRFDHENRRTFLESEKRDVVPSDPAVVVRHTYRANGYYKEGNGYE